MERYACGDWRRMWQAWHRPTQCGGGFIGSSNLCGSTARWQRKLDPKMSQPYRPWHTHDEKWPLKPGEPVELDIEIWPTCIVVPPGYQLALTVRGKDYEVDGRRGTAERALPDEGRRPLPAYRPRRPSGKDFRRPQHAAFCRGQAALPLVAGHSGRVSFIPKS